MDLEREPQPQTHGGAADSEDATLSDDEWPVDEHYFVEPVPAPVQAELESIRREEPGPSRDPRRRSRVPLALLLVLLALLALLNAELVRRYDRSDAHLDNVSGDAGLGCLRSPGQRPAARGRAGATREGRLPGASSQPHVGCTAGPGARAVAGRKLEGRLEVVRRPYGWEGVEASRGSVARRAHRRRGFAKDSRSRSPIGATARTVERTGGDSARPGSSVECAGRDEERRPAGRRKARADRRARRRKLAGAGLEVSVAQVPSGRPEHSVVSQSPSAGAEVRKGTSVTIRVSTGPAQVTVPSVVGLDEQSARDQLEAAGFVVRMVDESTTDPSQDGMVTAQEPSGGTDAPKGSTVVLTVARLS
ncbi:MAG: PASTA domain-containing protein [Actinobacteria bacterium]|nr:MAG: PASTA domain-containing protein [Actinomycetota bacterium]